MSKIVDELKGRYPKAKILYAPEENCRTCKGSGEFMNKLKNITLCICTCVSLPDIGGIFNDSIKKMSGELEEDVQLDN